MSPREIESIKKLREALRDSPEIAVPITKKAFNKMLLRLLGRLKPYPPQPDRMRSGRLNTYVRGIGHFPRSAFVEGQLKKRGAYEAGPRGGTVRRTSERLGTKWTYEVREIPHGVEGVLGNTASYARYVQGDLQPPYHKATGWVTAGDALTDERPEMIRILSKAGNEVTEAIANAAE